VLPSGDPCNPSGASRVYGRQFSNGLTTVKDPTTLLSTLYVNLGGTVTDLRYLSVNGKPALVSGTDSGAVGQININPVTSTQLRRLNWRELQVVD
jgi:type IV pilus assembly protein PilY1